MEIKEFIDKFVEALELEDVELTEASNFRELEDWDSLAALSTISMIDDEYHVTITNKDLKGVCTIGELVALVESKK